MQTQEQQDISRAVNWNIIIIGKGYECYRTRLIYKITT